MFPSPQLDKTRNTSGPIGLLVRRIYSRKKAQRTQRKDKRMKAALIVTNQTQLKGPAFFSLYVFSAFFCG